MQELAELYRAVIVDHSKRPRNFGRLATATHSASGDNPLCGDTIHVDLELVGNTVTDVRFEGSGCAIATASASLMAERLEGRTLDEARALLDRMEAVCTGQPAGDARADDELGDLAVFRGVQRYPVRVKCALLAWQTLRRALRL